MGWRDQSKYYTESKPENAVAKPSSSGKPAQTQSASAVTPQAQQTPAVSHANDNFWQRAVNTVQGGLRSWWSGKSAAVGQALDFGNWLNGKSSVADRAIADSDYAGWVTDPLAEATFKEQWQKGNLRSAGILKENKETARKVNAYADTVSEKGQKDIAEAQEGLGFVGRTLVGAGSSAVEMGLDFASSYLLGAVGGGMSAAGSGGRAVLNSARSGATALVRDAAGKATLASMATRVYGSAAQEARRNGATAAQAQTVGLMSAATEVFSESIFGGFGRVYGKGFADGIGNRVAMNLAKSPAGYRVLKTIFAGVEEGSEEIISQVMEPFAKAIYAGHGSYLDRVGQAYDEQEAMDYVSSFATGALLGLLGEGRAELSRGGRANSNNTYNAMTELEKAGVNTREMTEEQIQMAYALKEAGTDVNSLKAKDQAAPWGRIEEAYEALTPEQKAAVPGGQAANPAAQTQSPATADSTAASIDLNEPVSIPTSAADLGRSATHYFELARAAQVAANNATDDAQREAFMQKVYEYNAAYEAQQAVNLVVNTLQPTDEALSNLVGNDTAMDLYQALTGDLAVPRGKGQRGAAIDHITAFLGNRAAAANRASQQKPAGAPQSNADSRATNNPAEAAANATAQSQQFNSKPERVSNVTGEPMNEYEARFWDETEARFWDEANEADEPLRSEEPGATMRAKEEAAAQAAPETTEGGKEHGEERVPVQDAGRDSNEIETASAGRTGDVRGGTPDGENDSGRVRGVQSELREDTQEHGGQVSESSSDVRYGISEAVKKRANRARSIIEKFGKDAYTAVSQEATGLLTASGDARLLQTQLICTANNISEEVTNKSLFDLAVSDAIENAADGDPSILREALLSVTGEERVDDVIDMLLEGEERVRAKFTETEDSKGNKAVSVETPGKNATLPAGTRTVFFNSNKYRRQSNDVVVMRNLRGRIVKRGSAEEYYVVDWANNVWGAKFDSLGAAKNVLNNNAKTFLMTTFYLNGQEMEYTGGRLRVKNDQPFLDRSRMTVHNTSQAAEDLDVEFASYRRSPLTKSMAVMDFSLILDGDKSRSGTDNAKFDRSKRLEHFLRMGFYAADGTHWVFVGQTANQRKNNKCLVMPEQEYRKLRKRMVGGFDPDTIAKFNPAKYLTNQGFYFTPSNADTGVKMEEVIVAGDIYKQMGTTVRRRLVTSNGEAAESEKIVGQAYMVFGDLISNMTDGTGFIWDPKLGDKTKSMQFRAIGGFKGFAGAYNWAGQLQDVIPEGVEYAWLGEDGEVAGGMRKVNGKVEILDKWGTWQTIEGKKMLLFDSCVKFAEFYENSDDFYSRLKGVDVRSIPRENVYGSREGGGMLSEHHRAGLRQLLRTQPAPTAEIFKEIIDENITDPIAYILEDKKRLGKVLGVDFDSKTPPVGGDTPAYLAYYFGPDFFDTMLGQYFLRSKIQSVLDDFRGGKLYFQDGKENYQWLGEDPAGVFNAMTSLVFQHTESKLEEVKKSGAKVADEHQNLTDTRFQKSEDSLIDTFLKKGEIQNFNLEGVKFDENGNLVDGSGDTLIGRFPNMEMSDLQIRRNARNAAYEAMMEKYGADKDVTWLSLNDALTLFLDSDFDGDTSVAAQGAIVKAIKKIREEMGGKIQGEYNPADIFTEIAHGKAEKQMVQDVDTLIAAISAGMKAEEEEGIGKFDTGIEYMSAFSDEELRRAVNRYNEAHPTAKITGDVHEQARKYRSYVTALFAAAYKLNIDYAKTMWYPPEFRNVVDSYLHEISVIAEENGYYVEGSKKAVPASWEYAGSKKQKRFKDVQWAERDWDTKKQGKKPKFFISGGPSILDTMYNTDNDALAKHLPKDIAAYFQAYDEFRDWMDDKGFGGIDLSVLSTVDRMALNQLFSGSEDGKALRIALVDAYEAIMKSQGPVKNTKGNAYREQMLYELYKATGLDNEQFTSAMLYVLSTKANRTGWKTLFNFDPKTHDRFSKEDSSSDIISRNARILANLKNLENTLPEARAALEEAQKKLDDFQRAADANEEQRIRREFGIRVNMSAEIERLNGIIKDLTHRLSVMEHAIQNYGNSVKDIKTLEEALANTQAYHEYADRAAKIKQQLIEAQKELHAVEDISEAAKRRMNAIYGRYDAQIQKVDAAIGRLTDALDAAHEDYARTKAAAEDAYSAKEYYGIGVEQRTGFEEKNLSNLTDEIEALTEDFENRYSNFGPRNTDAEQKADEKRGRREEAPPPHTDRDAPPEREEAPPHSSAPSSPPPRRDNNSERQGPAGQQRQQEQKAETEQPQKTASGKNRKAYGEAYGRVNDAANGINTAIGKGAKTAVPASALEFLGVRFGDFRAALSDFGKTLLNAFYTDDGGKSLVDFAANLRNTIADSEALRFAFDDPKNSNIVRTADLLRKAEEGQQFEAASAAFMEEIQKEIESLPQTLEMLGAIKKRVEKLKNSSKLLKFISGTKPGAALVSMYVGWQRDTVNILQGLDGFDKYAGGPGYKLAQKIKDNVYAALKVSGNAKAAVLAAQKAFNEDPISRKTIAIELIRNGEKEQHTIEMADAIDLLHIFDTIVDSKLNPNDGMYYGLGNGDVLHLGQPEHYIAVRNAIEKAVNGNKAAKAYYDALSEAYDAYARPVQNAVKSATGRNMRLYRKGHYYPISISMGKGNNTSGRDGSFGLDNLGFTQERTKIKGGYIKVYDPAQRFASYDQQATKLISAAEAGATMQRLSRDGAGDNLLSIIRNTWGQGAVDTVEQFIKDASNFRAEEDASANIFRKLRLNLQKGALFGNVGSMLKQYPSVFNAVGVLDMGSVLHGIAMMTSAENRARAASQGAIKTRRQGNLDSTIAEVLKPEAKKRMQKVLNAIGSGFEYVDSKAIMTLWLASEHQAQKDALSPAMQEELFKEAFLQTQPQFSKLLRPYVQTSEKEWVRLFGMFKTQPLRNLNTMIRAINEYRAANAEHKAKAAAALRKTLSGQVVSSVMFGALGVAAKLLYHRRKDLEDEDGNLDGTKIIARIAFNSIEASSGMLIFGDTLAQWIIDKATKNTDVETNDYYGVSAGWVSTVVDTFSSFNDFIDKPSMYGFKKLAGNLATDFGIPLNNAYAIVNSLVMYAKDINGTNTMRYNDMLQLADKYRKMKPKELVAVTIDEALLQLRRGNSARATAMMQTLSADQAEDIKKYLTKTFASGNMTRTLLEEYLKNYAGLDGEDLEKALKAADIDAAYERAFDANPGGVKAVKDQIDAVKTVEGGEPRAMQVADIIMSSSLTDSQKQALMDKFVSESYLKGFNALTAAGYSSKEAVDLIDSINSDDQATLTQKELFRYFLEHPDDRKGIEAIWNELHPDDTITETYADTGIKKAFYEDRMTSDESIEWLVKNAGYVQEEAEKKVESWAEGKDFWLASQANEESFDALAEEISDIKRDMGRRGENSTFDVANAVLNSNLNAVEKELALDHYMSDKFLGVFYGLRGAGYSDKDAVAAYKNVVGIADGLDGEKLNGSLTQKEMLAAYRQDRSLGDILEVIWNASGYKKTWDDVT